MACNDEAHSIYLAVLLWCLCLTHPAPAQGTGTTSEPAAIEWHPGPYEAHLGTIAMIKVPKGYLFADAQGTKRFMELTHNPSEEGELGLITPAPSKANDSGATWYVVFQFSNVGYVSDEEKSSLDAGAILGSLQKNTEKSNEYRREKGWAAFHVTGWQTPPFYDEKTHNLTWATLGQSDDTKEGTAINHSTRILGRRGAMSVDLVLSPEDMSTAVPASAILLSGFEFTQGSRYMDFVKGDEVAKYGLTALIAGGATAVAIKSGFFAKILALLAALWKVLAVAFVAMLTAIKRFFSGLFKKKSDARELPLSDAKETSFVSSDHDVQR